MLKSRGTPDILSSVEFFLQVPMEDIRQPPGSGAWIVMGGPASPNCAGRKNESKNPSFSFPDVELQPNTRALVQLIPNSPYSGSVSRLDGTQFIRVLQCRGGEFSNFN